MRPTLRTLLFLLTSLPLLCLSVAGFLAISETGSSWLLRQAISYAPGELRVADIRGRLITGLVLTEFSYRLEQTELQASEISIRWQPAALLHGTLRIQALHARDVLYHDAGTTETDTTPFTLPERLALPVRIALHNVQITGLRLDRAGDQSVIEELNLSARAGPVKGLVVKRFEIRTPDSTAQLTGKASLHQPYAFKCEADWSTRLPDGVRAAGHARLNGDTGGLQLDHTLSEPFHVTSSGTVQFDDGTPVLALSGEWQTLRWPLSGAALYTSARGDYRFNGTVAAYQFQLNGPVQGQDMPDLLLRATGSGDTQQIRLEPLDIDALGGSLSSRGSLAWSPQFSLGLDIQAKDLDPGRAWPDWPGRLQGATRLDIGSEGDSLLVALRKLNLQGTLQGHPLAARGELTLRDGIPGSSGLVVTSGKNRVELAGVVDSRKGVHFRVAAPELGALLPQLDGSLDADGVLKGPLDRPGGSIKLTATRLTYDDKSVAALRIEGSLERDRPAATRVTIEAEELSLGQTKFDSLRLENHGWIDAHRTSLRLTSQQGTADIQLLGSYVADTWQGRLANATFDLAELGKWQLQEDVQLHVTRAGQVSPLHGCWKSAQRELCLRGDASRDSARLALTGRSAEGQIGADLKILQLTGDRPALSGNVALNLPDIRFLDTLAKDVTVAGGAISAQARLAGYLDAPQVTGTAELKGGLLNIPQLGLELKQIGLQARGKGTRIGLQGTAHSGDGDIRLSGELALNPQQGWPFDLMLKGQRFAIIRLPEVDIDADPDLKIHGTSKLVAVTGSVLVPHARIKIKRLPPDVVKVSADQIIVGPAGQSADASATTVPVTINVTARLGKDVHFDGLGLSTGLAGSLNVRSLQTRTLIGNGVLELTDGRYEGYGQKLAIEHGRLLFAGPLDNPALDIRATRKAGDVVAGIELSGTVDAPQTRLFSIPAMSDAEAMSYLVTGKPLNRSSTGDDSQALAAAAASLGANSPVGQAISEELGLEVGVESGTTDEDTALVVGKQLSPRLYVDYVYGLFTETAAVQFVYKLTEHFSLAGQSGAEQSIDLRFSIDRK